MSANKKQCRACLCYGKHSYNLESSDVLEIFVYCISLPITINDFLPKALCNKCYELLIKFYEFKHLCTNSEKILFDEKKCLVTKGQHKLSKKNKKKNLNCDPDIEIKLEESQNEIDTMNQEFDDSTANENPDFDYDMIDFVDHSSETSLNNEITHIETKKKCISKISKKKDSGEELIPYPKNIPKTKAKIDIECCICNSKFKSKGALRTHEEIQHKIEVENKCNICNKVFKSFKGLKSHVKIHAYPEKKPKACPTCGKVYMIPAYLEAHLKTHLVPKQPCICHICARTLKSRKSLNVHLKTHSNDEVPRHECEICKRKYFSSYKIKSHKALCHGPQTVTCEICGVIVADKYRLKNHMVVHSGLKPYVCNFCNKAFPRKLSLTIHTRIHTGERPFPCNFCYRRCISRERLVLHLRTHTGDKPYMCTICNRGFAQVGTLTAHRKTHKS